MADIEMDKCDFCKQFKSVERTYLKPANYVKPTQDYLKLHNEGNYFIIVKTCSECGVPADQQTLSLREELEGEKRILSKLYSDLVEEGRKLQKAESELEAVKSENEKLRKERDEARQDTLNFPLFLDDLQMDGDRWKREYKNAPRTYTTKEAYDYWVSIGKKVRPKT
jgi:hypothetical protein